MNGECPRNETNSEVGNLMTESSHLTTLANIKFGMIRYF